MTRFPCSADTPRTHPSHLSNPYSTGCFNARVLNEFEVSNQPSAKPTLIRARLGQEIMPQHRRVELT